MKKLFFALMIVLTAATAAQAQSKIAHVNSQKLLDTLPSRKLAIADIGGIEKRGLDELTEMDNNIKKMYAQYMKDREGMSLSAREYEEGRIQKKQAELEARQTEIDELLQRMSGELNTKILASVKEAVDIVAKRKGFNYVIDESAVLFANGTNITNEVITELLRIDAEKAKAAAGTGTGTTPPKQ